MHPGVIALIAAGGLLVGGLLWAGLLYLRHRQLLSTNSLFRMVLVSGILCRLAYVFFTPIFYAPDEQSHFNYIKYLTENHSFPVLTKAMGDPANEWEYHQPPLYYLALTPVFCGMEAMFHSQAATVVALRFCSVCLWLLTLKLALMWLKRFGVEDELLRLCTLCVICLLPTYVFVSSAINNDNLIISLAAGVICVMTGAKASLKTSALLGVLLGVSLWAKSSGLVLFPAVGLLFVLEGWRGKIGWRTALLNLFVIFGLAILIYLPWALRTLRIYGNFSPESLSVALKSWPSIVDGLVSATHNLVKTFWSVSGISNDVGYPFPLLGFCFGTICLAGFAFARKQNPKAFANFTNGPEGSLYAALILAIVLNVVLVLRLGYLYGMGQGRHLFAMLFPIALLLGWGLKFIPANNAAVHVVGFWITYALAFEAFSLSRFPH